MISNEDIGLTWITDYAGTHIKKDEYWICISKASCWNGWILSIGKISMGGEAMIFMDTGNKLKYILLDVLSDYIERFGCAELLNRIHYVNLHDDYGYTRMSMRDTLDIILEGGANC